MKFEQLSNKILKEALGGLTDSECLDLLDKWSTEISRGVTIQWTPEGMVITAGKEKILATNLRAGITALSQKSSLSTGFVSR